MPLFTRENAAIMARKANLVRWSRPPEPEPEPPSAAGIAEEQTKEIAQATLAEVRNLLGRLRKRPQMAPDKLDMITRSLERLWKIHAHAGAIPLPAPRKEKRRNSGSIELVPTIDLLPEPDAAAGPPAILPDAADSQS